MWCKSKIYRRCLYIYFVFASFRVTLSDLRTSIILLSGIFCFSLIACYARLLSVFFSFRLLKSADSAGFLARYLTQVTMYTKVNYSDIRLNFVKLRLAKFLKFQTSFNTSKYNDTGHFIHKKKLLDCSCDLKVLKRNFY